MAEQTDKFPKEKRRSPRVSGAMVEYSFIGKNESVKKAFIKDICIHGICIYMPETIKDEKNIIMEIFLFGSETPIKSEGRIVWHKSGEYLGYNNVGIEFTQMPDEDKKRLSGYIKASLKQDKDL